MVNGNNNGNNIPVERDMPRLSDVRAGMGPDINNNGQGGPNPNISATGVAQQQLQQSINNGLGPYGALPNFFGNNNINNNISNGVNNNNNNINNNIAANNAAAGVANGNFNYAPGGNLFIPFNNGNNNNNNGNGLINGGGISQNRGGMLPFGNDNNNNNFLFSDNFSGNSNSSTGMDANTTKKLSRE